MLKAFYIFKVLLPAFASKLNKTHIFNKANDK